MSNVAVSRSDNVLVKVVTDHGLVGWGECVAAPTFTGDTQASLLASLAPLVRQLRGRRVRAWDDIWRVLTRDSLGCSAAVGALDIALHDILGQLRGVPVCQLLNARVRSTIPALILVGAGDRHNDLQKVKSQHSRGVRGFKVKLGIDRLESELEFLRDVIEASGDQTLICGDANGAWTEDEALWFLNQLAGLPIRFIEQPVRDRAALIKVAKQSPVPICADESVMGLEDIEALGETAIAGVSLKLIKLGGITGLMRGVQRCQSFGLSINLAGKVAETSIAAAANLHAAAAIDRIDFGVSPANQGIKQDVCEQPLSMQCGVFQVPQAPGLGITVDEARVDALRRFK